MDLKLLLFLSLVYLASDNLCEDISNRKNYDPITYKEFTNLICNMENNIKNLFDKKLRDSKIKIAELIKDETVRIEKESYENIKKCINDEIKKDINLDKKSTGSNISFQLQCLIDVFDKRSKCGNCKGCKNNDICFYHLLMIFISLFNEEDKVELQKSLSIFHQMNNRFFRQPNMCNIYGLQPNINSFMNPLYQNMYNLNQPNDLFSSCFGMQYNKFGMNIGNKDLLHNLLINSVFDIYNSETSSCDSKKQSHHVTTNYGPSFQTNNPTLINDPKYFDQNNFPTSYPILKPVNPSVYSPNIPSKAPSTYGPCPFTLKHLKSQQKCVEEAKKY
ncbi:hypothetical protein NAPIS_ORF01822 [Vairimorpha apis BRL 01]|uniref:Uncharacterized protein n=1 Tax=Vairimorpha apis BRL 01 TaxID=1037528 RepID=T0MBN7_9MICR|nr:hypothetical protein NAPIS_ORF01822 [Vairimorpha apis BRL 01]